MKPSPHLPCMLRRSHPSRVAVPAAEAVSRRLQSEVLAQVDSASQALLHSQTGASCCTFVAALALAFALYRPGPVVLAIESMLSQAHAGVSSACPSAARSLSNAGVASGSTQCRLPSRRQRQATAVVEDSLSAQLHTQLDRSSSCLLVSQQGPFAGRLFTVLPVSPQFGPFALVPYARPWAAPTPPSHLRSRLPVPSSPQPLWRPPRSVRPGWVLRIRGCPLERAAARVCREAGARVTVNSRFAGMNLPVDRLDDRRLEVVARLPLWNGAQVAVDATFASVLFRRAPQTRWPFFLSPARLEAIAIGRETG